MKSRVALWYLGLAVVILLGGTGSALGIRAAGQEAAPAAARATGSTPALPARWVLAVAPHGPAREVSMVYDSARRRVVAVQGGETWEYDGTAWVHKAPVVALPTRISPALAYDSDRQRVVLFGGGAPHNDLDDTWEYDGTTWTQQHPAVAPPPRRRAALAYDRARRRLVLFAGAGYTEEGMYTLADTWEYDGRTWTPMHPATAPPGRDDHVLIYDSTRRRIILFGGMGEEGSPPLGTATWEYDGTTWAPTAAPVLPDGVGRVLSYDSGRGRIVAFAGTTGTWEYDGTAWTRRATPAASPPGDDSPALAYDSGRGRSVFYSPSAGTWEWDGSTWTRAVSPTGPLSYATRLAYDSARSRVVAFAGVGETWEYDGTAWIQQHPLANPPARDRDALAYDSARHRLVVFGGQGFTLQGDIVLSDTWEYDGTTWALIHPAGAPPARQGQALAYDSARRRIVLFGGADARGTPLNDTWEYDGATWTLIHPAGAPPAREGHALAYDSARGRIVLFGGTGLGLSTFADTWEYDGSTWTLMHPATAPPGRTAPALAYDSARGRMVLFGGQDLNGRQFADTWEYDGSIWTPGATGRPPPPARSEHSLAYDSARQRMILFGGRSDSENGVYDLNDTWEYDPGIAGHYFAATGKAVSGRFWAVWQEGRSYADSLYLNGLPISDVHEEVSPADGKIYAVQWFERARLEAHPENRPPYDVLLGRLGVPAVAGRAAGPFGPVGNPGGGVPWFPATRHTLGDGSAGGRAIAAFWTRLGAQQQFGYPLSEPFPERSRDDGKVYLVQYFERARFEYHPEHAGTRYTVQLGRLGAEQAAVPAR